MAFRKKFEYTMVDVSDHRARTKPNKSKHFNPFDSSVTLSHADESTPTNTCQIFTLQSNGNGNGDFDTRLRVVKKGKLFPRSITAICGSSNSNIVKAIAPDRSGGMFSNGYNSLNIWQWCDNKPAIDNSGYWSKITGSPNINCQYRQLIEKCPFGTTNVYSLPWKTEYTVCQFGDTIRFIRNDSKNDENSESLEVKSEEWIMLNQDKILLLMKDILGSFGLFEQRCQVEKNINDIKQHLFDVCGGVDNSTEIKFISDKNDGINCQLVWCFVLEISLLKEILTKSKKCKNINYHRNPTFYYSFVINICNLNEYINALQKSAESDPTIALNKIKELTHVKIDYLTRDDGTSNENNCFSISDTHVSPDGTKLSYQSLFVCDDATDTKSIKFVELRNNYLLPRDLNISKDEKTDGLLLEIKDLFYHTSFGLFGSGNDYGEFGQYIYVDPLTPLKLHSFNRNNGGLPLFKPESLSYQKNGQIIDQQYGLGVWGDDNMFISAVIVHPSNQKNTKKEKQQKKEKKKKKKKGQNSDSAENMKKNILRMRTALKGEYFLEIVQFVNGKNYNYFTNRYYQAIKPFVKIDNNCYELGLIHEILQMVGFLKQRVKVSQNLIPVGCVVEKSDFGENDNCVHIVCNNTFTDNFDCVTVRIL